MQIKRSKNRKQMSRTYSGRYKMLLYKTERERRRRDEGGGGEGGGGAAVARQTSWQRSIQTHTHTQTRRQMCINHVYSRNIE